MKKLALIAVLFSLVTTSAKAQWFDFSNNATDATIGFNIGAVGYHFNGQIDKTYSDLGFGVSCSFAGVYLDFIYQWPEHEYDNKVAAILYNDHTALTINVGYKIPVTSWLNVTPLIGYSNETTGITDCSTININYESHSFYHDYEREHIYNHFNYGIGVSVKPVKMIEIGAVCTAHAVYGNVSLNLFEVKN